MDLVVSYMDNLTKVPRFDVIVMCLPSAAKDGMYVFLLGVKVLSVSMIAALFEIS